MEHWCPPACQRSPKERTHMSARRTGWMRPVASEPITPISTRTLVSAGRSPKLPCTPSISLYVPTECLAHLCIETCRQHMHMRAGHTGSHAVARVGTHVTVQQRSWVSAVVTGMRSSYLSIIACSPHRAPQLNSPSAPSSTHAHDHNKLGAPALLSRPPCSVAASFCTHHSAHASSTLAAEQHIDA